MSTIENNFAAGTAAVSNGFSGSILGQANRIGTLQNNGVAAFTGQPLGGAPAAAVPGAQGAPVTQVPRTVEQAIAMLNRDPSLLPQALQALQDPQILRTTLATLQQKPELIQALPLQIQQFLHYVLSGGTSACGR